MGRGHLKTTWLKCLATLAWVFSAPTLALAAGSTSVCSKYVEDRGYQKFYTTGSGTRAAGDTIYWETRVLPDFQRIVKDPKFQNEAVLNSKFKAMLASYGLREGEISSANQDRILKDCHAQPELEGCLAMQTYCVRDYVQTQFPKAMENFIGCADATNRQNGCGADFQTAEGIQKNLNVLKNFDKAISAIDADLMELPNVPEYLQDIKDSFQAYSARIQALLDKGKKDIEQLKKQEAATANTRYQNAKAGANALGGACRAFDECKGYIERQGYTDTKALLDQISSCSIDGQSNSATSKQFDATMESLKGIQAASHQEALAALAKETFEASLQSTARQYLEGHLRVNGKLPTASAFCAAIGRCGDLKIQAVYDSVKADQAAIIRMDLPAEIAEFNGKVKALNSACAEARKVAKEGSPTEGTIEKVGQAHAEVVYGTSFGNLFAIDQFSDKVGKFDQNDCVEDGVGIRELDPKTDQDRIKKSLNSLLGTIAEKGRELSNEEEDLTDPKDPGPGIRHFLEYEPLVLREMIRASNIPEQAMLLCQAIEKIYAKEASRRLRSKVLTGLSIAGGIAAIILTGGAATPLVLAAASVTGGTAIAIGITNSVIDIRNAQDSERKYEQSSATGTFDRSLANSLIKDYGMEVRAETVGLVLNFVPGVGKAAGNTLSKTLIQPAMQRAMRNHIVDRMANTAAWKTAAKATSYSAKGVGTLMAKINEGTAVVGDVSAALVAKIHPGTSRTMITFFNSATKGMSEDMALTFTAMALTHPDPYSESGMLELFESFIASRGMAALGGSGRQVYSNLKGQIAVTSVRRATAARPPSKSEIDGLRVKAETELGRKVSDAELKGIHAAHAVGQLEPGKDASFPAEKYNYTPAQLKEKTRILREAGLSDAEATRLIRGEVAGVGTISVSAQRAEILASYPVNPRAIEKWRTAAQEELRKNLAAQGVKNADQTAGSIVRNAEKEALRARKSNKPVVGSELLSERLRNGKSGPVSKTFEISDAAAKTLGKAPNAISDKLSTWMTSVEKNGIAETRKISGYHDEPVDFDYPGARSIRLNQGVRAIYRIRDGKIEIIAVGNRVYKH